MKYLSVCSGIEAASVAWHPLFWEPLAFSEIEAFPRAVLAHHYPGVPCHGDFTKLRDEAWIADADILVGGTPCQAFSVAGLRNSLADDRGNLSLEFVRLADAIDDLRHSGGRNPSIIVWENVPGVLSVKDNAFGCFLAALAGDAAPYVPPRGKWTNAGVVDGPARTVAWRILDAQYFGLAQRRRRVFVVASARDGFDPASVLLEWEGLRRDTPPRREAREGTAHATAPCLTSSGRCVERTGDTRGQDSVVAVEMLADTLSVGANQTTGFSSPSVVGYASTGDISHCLNAGGMGRQDYETETLIAHTLKGEGFDASEDGTGRGTPLVPVAQAVSLRGRDGGGTAELGGDIQNALRASQGGGDKPHVLAQMAVRRLVPEECEALQGFPRGYTNIPWRGKPEAPDGPRYKALGNSMAVPVMRWIGTRIQQHLGGEL
jgi:DNA (cytosine-5)-methyltransferase 1